MVIIVKDGTKEERIRDLIQWIESQNLRTHVSTGDYSTIIGVIGDTSKLDEDLISGLDIVEGVKRVSEPFKSANRKFATATSNLVHVATLCKHITGLLGVTGGEASHIPHFRVEEQVFVVMSLIDE